MINIEGDFWSLEVGRNEGSIDYATFYFTEIHDLNTGNKGKIRNKDIYEMRGKKVVICAKSK